MRLTDPFIKNIVPPTKGQKTYYDNLHGFGIRVSQGGAKTFVIDHKQGRRTTIGRYTLISLAEARAEAKRILAQETLNKHRPTSIRFQDAKTLYLAHIKQTCRPRTHSDYSWLLGRNFAFQGYVADISTGDITFKLDRIKSPSERKYATAVIKAFFNWCYKRGYLDHSPAGRLTATPVASRERILTHDELKAIWKACDGTFGVIVKLLILTGQRRGEVSAFQPSWLEGNKLTLPAVLTKNKREHIIPIAEDAVPLVAQLKPFNSWSKSKAALDKKCGVKDWRLHDLRRTFRTQWAELGISNEVAERYINHISGQSQLERTYNRAQYLSQMQDAVARWSAFLHTLLA